MLARDVALAGAVCLAAMTYASADNPVVWFAHHLQGTQAGSPSLLAEDEARATEAERVGEGEHRVVIPVEDPDAPTPRWTGAASPPTSGT